MASVAIDDSLQSRVSADCPDTTREILYHAWSHDLTGLKPLLDAPGKASAQDPTTGETPLHAAIRACGPGTSIEEYEDEDGCVEEAKEVLHELFTWGAIWNDMDSHRETPGCLAARLNRPELYRLCVEAGVRAEMLFGLLDGYEELESGDEEEEMQNVEVVEVQNDSGSVAAAIEPGQITKEETSEEKKFQHPKNPEDTEVTSEEYLNSKLTYSDGKLVDDGGNGVMMAWETDIMRKSVDAILPDLPSGKRILNVGLGMGIIDSMFAGTKPSRHHIIEAHPGVLEHLSQPDAKWGGRWEASGPVEGAFKVHRGKWQDVVPKLLEEGEIFDAIYFDTFGEDYSQLKLFFTEYVPVLLEQKGRFGFFNGLGADRRVCYDVYTKVAEMHLTDAGMDVEWEGIDVDMEGMGEAGRGEWEGVRRRYWTLDSRCLLRSSLHCLKLSCLTCNRIPATRLHVLRIDMTTRYPIFYSALTHLVASQITLAVSYSLKFCGY